MRGLFFFLLMCLKLPACTLCASYTPSSFVQLNFTVLHDKIKAIDIEWKFSQEFTQTLMENYDLNYNDHFDDDEINIIENALLDYLNPNKYLTQILIYENEKSLPIELRFENKGLQLKNSQFSYFYTVFLDIDLAQGKIFNLKIHDSNDFFKFQFHNPKHFPLNDTFYLSANENLDFIFFQIMKGDIKEHMVEEKQEIEKKKLDLQQLNSKLFSFVKEFLKKEIDLQTLASLMFISFIYGIFHATGPGHAKTLTSSYFLTHQSSGKKILIFCLKIGFVHILSAFLLVSIAILFLQIFIRSFSNDASFILTKISGALIVFIAIFMLMKKISTQHSKDCPCCQKNAHFKEWTIISAAAIVPCPGTLLLFVFAYEINFFSALLSAIFVSFGMSFVLFIFALFSHKIRLQFTHYKWRLFLEYLGIIFMLCFGFFIFINTKAELF